ncbi:MAG: dependent epimerase/dehydratase family protein [Chthoniobacter sp.]|nr:dependent epimerase/dehydratase family protein [Chthoniobacter sp.]
MPRVLIAGCGFVGLATARLFHNGGWEVIGCTHSGESAARLQEEPFMVEACDFADRSALAAKASGWRGFNAVIHCASSGKGGVEAYRRVYLEGARNLSELLEPARLVFTGSTSVYAQTTGEWVTEESAAEPDRETGKVLRETEELVLATGGAVARLAGIYGPGRSVLLRKFLADEALIEGGGERWINQVHRADIAAALLTLVQSGARGLFNVSDDQPIRQRELYAWLAERFHRPLPPSGPVDSNRKRGWTNKRVSNSRLRALGWAPRYPSFFDAVANDRELVAGV